MENELSTPKARPRLPTYLTLTEVINRKVAHGEREIVAYYEPKLDQLRLQILDLQEEVRELEEERDQALTRLKTANERPVYTEDLCHICWGSQANVTLECGHSLCVECQRKVGQCPWDRRAIRR